MRTPLSGVRVGRCASVCGWVDVCVCVCVRARARVHRQFNSEKRQFNSEKRQFNSAKRLFNSAKRLFIASSTQPLFLPSLPPYPPPPCLPASLPPYLPASNTCLSWSGGSPFFLEGTVNCIRYPEAGTLILVPVCVCVFVCVCVRACVRACVRVCVDYGERQEL